MTKVVAYFSSEVGLESDIPTYSGGLGVLAGDTGRSAADLGLSFVGISILPRLGYFRQEINGAGEQVEHFEKWFPGKKMHRLLGKRAHINLYGNDVEVLVWRYDIVGRKGIVPWYLLDAGNVTEKLYNDERLAQCAVLAIGGMQVLQNEGYDVCNYQMNESHSALIVPFLLKECGDIEKVRERCTFTTHSNVAGHEDFDYDYASRLLGDYLPKNIQALAGNGRFNMTTLAMSGSRFVNGVSKLHAKAASEMHHRDIRSITNGVHPYTWTSPEFQELYDREIPEWRADPGALKNANIPPEKIAMVRAEAKRRFVDYVYEKTGVRFDPNLPVIVWARRFMDYKRPWLLTSDMPKLTKILKGRGQIVYAGKAHPHYQQGKDTIRYINQREAELRREGISAAFIPDYRMDDCKALSAADIWLNTPEILKEASGTSGMCAALNGTPQLTSQDGWVPEGVVDGVSGLIFGGSESGPGDANSLYEKLDTALERGCTVMPGVITIGGIFNTHRMLKEYEEAWGINL